jgi:hypothetical protein
MDPCCVESEDRFWRAHCVVSVMETRSERATGWETTMTSNKRYCTNGTFVQWEMAPSSPRAAEQRPGTQRACASREHMPWSCCRVVPERQHNTQHTKPHQATQTRVHTGASQQHPLSRLDTSLAPAAHRLLHSVIPFPSHHPHAWLPDDLRQIILLHTGHVTPVLVNFSTKEVGARKGPFFWSHLHLRSLDPKGTDKYGSFVHFVYFFLAYSVSVS